MAEEILSKQIENEAKTQVATAMQEVTTGMQLMMNAMEAWLDELQKEMVQNKRLGDDWHRKLQQEGQDPKGKLKQVCI